jgi:hypothetical protein
MATLFEAGVSRGPRCSLHVPEAPMRKSNFSTYDAIGFEVDHCLVEYQSAYKKEVFNCFVQGLKDKGYVIEEQGGEFEMQDSLWDIAQGTVLHLDANSVILSGYRGPKQLTGKEVEAMYGKERLFTFEKEHG